MNDRPVVLVYQHFFPDYSAGGPVTSIGNLALALKTRRDVRVIASDKVYSTGEPMRNIKSNTWSTWQGVAVWYASDRESVRNAIKGLPPDAIMYLNGIFLIDYFLVPLRQALRQKLQVIIAPRGMLQQGALRSGFLKKKLFLRMLTSVWLSGRELWHATDEEEQHDVEKWISRRSGVSMIPNLPRPAIDKPLSIIKKVGELKLIYYSLISRKKNLLFLIDALSSPALSHVSLDIAGPIKDDDYWETCKSEIALMPNPSRVKYIGEKDPAGAVQLLSQYHFFALSTEGENFGHAIVEALGSGRPVLISNRTPWKDVEAAGAGFALELNADVWLREIIGILQWDQSQFDRSVAAALSYYKQKIDMDDMVEKYCRLFERASA